MTSSSAGFWQIRYPKRSYKSSILSENCKRCALLIFKKQNYLGKRFVLFKILVFDEWMLPQTRGQRVWLLNWINIY
jgi:hypothetical protein